MDKDYLCNLFFSLHLKKKNLIKIISIRKLGSFIFCLISRSLSLFHSLSLFCSSRVFVCQCQVCQVSVDVSVSNKVFCTVHVFIRVYLAFASARSNGVIFCEKCDGGFGGGSWFPGLSRRLSQFVRIRKDETKTEKKKKGYCGRGGESCPATDPPARTARPPHTPGGSSSRFVTRRHPPPLPHRRRGRRRGGSGGSRPATSPPSA